MERGRYAAQLEWWLRHFRREQLLLLQYERCVADPQGQLTRTFEFLGLPPQAASAAEVARARKKSGVHVPLAEEIRAFCEGTTRLLRATLIRINPGDPAVPPAHLSLPLGAREAVEQIDIRSRK